MLPAIANLSQTVRYVPGNQSSDTERLYWHVLRSPLRDATVLFIEFVTLMHYTRHSTHQSPHVVCGYVWSLRALHSQTGLDELPSPGLYSGALTPVPSTLLNALVLYTAHSWILAWPPLLLLKSTLPRGVSKGHFTVVVVTSKKSHTLSRCHSTLAYSGLLSINFISRWSCHGSHKKVFASIPPHGSLATLLLTWSCIIILLTFAVFVTDVAAAHLCVTLLH